MSSPSRQAWVYTWFLLNSFTVAQTAFRVAVSRFCKCLAVSSNCSLVFKQSSSERKKNTIKACVPAEAHILPRCAECPAERCSHHAPIRRRGTQWKAHGRRRGVNSSQALRQVPGSVSNHHCGLVMSRTQLSTHICGTKGEGLRGQRRRR